MRSPRASRSWEGRALPLNLHRRFASVRAHCNDAWQPTVQQLIGTCDKDEASAVEGDSLSVRINVGTPTDGEGQLRVGVSKVDICQDRKALQPR